MPVAAGKRGSARAVALPARRRGFDLRAARPSLKSVAIGLGLLVLAAGAYAAALETSVFAVRRLAVGGGSPRAQAEVRRALAPELGRSLLRVSGADLDRRTAKLPDVISVRFDRAFPHTLRVTVKAERAVLLLRRVKESWVVSARGRVMRKIPSPKSSSLPRMWIPKGTPVAVGETLSRANGALAAAAVAPIGKKTLPGGVRFVVSGASELTLVTGAGLEIRLGDIGDLRLKLAIARRILQRVGAAATRDSYIDVSVPERPVLATGNSQVAGTG